MRAVEVGRVDSAEQSERAERTFGHSLEFDDRPSHQLAGILAVVVWIAGN